MTDQELYLSLVHSSIGDLFVKMQSIAEILRNEDWSVSMLEDIAEIVSAIGFDLDIPPVEEYISH